MSKHERSFDKAAQEEAASLKQPQLKPFETPKGFVPPTLGEQFRYVRSPRKPPQNSIMRCTTNHCAVPSTLGAPQHAHDALAQHKAHKAAPHHRSAHLSQPLRPRQRKPAKVYLANDRNAGHHVDAIVQAYARHPYANTGFGAAFLIGVVAWWYASSSKPTPPAQQASAGAKS
jgi:hypothetical protein